MKLLIIGKEGRFVKNSSPEDLAKVEIVYASRDADAKEIIEKGKDAQLVLVDAMSALPGEAIRAMTQLKMIHSEGVGYQYVDVKTAAELGIPVCNCKGMNASAVAEHTVMLMMACLKDLINGHVDVLRAEQIHRKEAYMLNGNLKELGDCTVGLVGMGDIASETARMLQVFGPKVIYYSRHEAPAERTYGARYVSMEELLKESDFVSLHVPVTEETRNMANEAFLSRMKEGAFLINTSRGDLVKGEDLVKALEHGHLGGAGLDCLEKEPVQPDNVYLQASEAAKSKMILSPHIAGITASSFKRGYAMVWENIHRVINGEKPVRIVNGI